jgi:dienelactone hydrolase
MGGDSPLLGAFADWVGEARRQGARWPVAAPGVKTRWAVLDILGFADDAGVPSEPRVERAWERDGLRGEEISWSVGFGPRTHAWLLRPAGAEGPLPGVVALHGHGGFKFYGKETIADGPEALPEVVGDRRRKTYGGRAYANQLARRGFAVLVPDVFLWGSRRFALLDMPASIHAVVDDYRCGREREGQQPDGIELYNVAAAHHEHLITKYCTLLGTSLAGVVAREDRAAVAYLRSRPDVMPDRIGCVGLSGGGCRAALLQATCDHIGAAVVVGMMTTHEQLLERLVDQHTWMFFPPGLARLGDWPDVAACRAPSPLLVQYDRGDHLFTPAGMEAAHRRIGEHYQRAGAPAAYVGTFHDWPHKFDVAMQTEAFDWLHMQLGRG